MPRFALPRPTSFFRRKKSSVDGDNARNSNTTDINTATAYPINTTDSIDSTTRSPSQVTDGLRSTPDSRHLSDLGLALPSPRQTAVGSKRSASLTRLRDKFLERGAEVPESVQEVRESVLLDWELPQSHPRDTDSEPVSSRRSGSVTLAVGRSPAGESVRQEEEGGKHPRVTELKLDDCGLEHTAPDCPPAVVVEGPTPLGEGVKEISLLTQDQLLADDTPVNSASVSPLTHPADNPIRPAHDANANIVHTLVEAPSRHQASGSIPSFSSALPASAVIDYFTPGLPNMAQMLHRKIWVRRPGASATLVQIRGDDLVDDVREMILKKYKNSLGGTFDAPDMTLRIVQRAEQGQQQHERILGPEEDICHTIDMCYPGGQMVEEALVIDVPMRERRTPRPSPRAYHPSSYHDLDEYRPLENGTDYFPPMPPVVPQSMPQTTNQHDGRAVPHLSLAGGGPFPLEHSQRSMSVLNTGQIAPLPSPGGTMRQRGHRDHRPKFQRQHTSSPTIVQHPSSHPPGVNLSVVPVGATAAQSNLNAKSQHPVMHRSSIRPRTDSMASDAHHAISNGVLAPPGAQQASQPPSPSAPESKGLAPLQGGSTPPTPPSSTVPNGAPVGGGAGPPTLRPGRPKKTRKSTPDKPTSTSRPRHPDPLKPSPTSTSATAPKPNTTTTSAPAPPPSLSSVLDGSVPPINVLIVEDNIINLRILEGLMKRLRVRWQTAMNGQIAVDKWRAGGFHLVLMDIQMPVMNGLAATKEIRRLERVNGIGVFSEVVSPEEEEEGKAAPKKMGDVEVEDVAGEQNGSLAASPKRGSKSVTDDRLAVSSALFKSPIIIVALTASSLQSDRHEALAAGCNDFLTKPVDFVWLERKVKEWGCMQALIDFEGWRAWKVLVAREEEGKTDEQREQERLRGEKEKRRMEKMAVLQEKARVKKEEEERERERRRSKRVSGSGVEGGGVEVEN
ncbi:Two-component response regulator SSK1p [Friedmanniomyces endolithicus]|nr:Two-component response regulator SSK1p [Friedmanniomyces endolithicus]